MLVSKEKQTKQGKQNKQMHVNVMFCIMYATLRISLSLLCFATSTRAHKAQVE